MTSEPVPSAELLSINPKSQLTSAMTFAPSVIPKQRGVASNVSGSAALGTEPKPQPDSSATIASVIA